MASTYQGKLSSMKVEIHCKKWIKPSTPTPPHLHKLNLSSIDQIMPSKYVQLLFHFDIGNETDQVQTTPERLSRLEESLSQILTLYYPFAGRYDEDNASVSCQDQGVEFVVASVDRKLDELVDGGESDRNLLLSGLERLHSTLDVAWTPVVLVQVNLFTCGGLAIGLCFSHKVGDMFTIATFMDAWATACRLGTLDQVVRPSFSISSLLPRGDFHLPKPSNSEKPPLAPPPNYVTKRYIFTGEAITKLKSTVNGELNYTRVELVTALITRTLIGIECSKRRPFMMFHPMNLRSRTALPIEANSCGNIITIVVAALEVEDGALELPKLAGFIRNSIRNAASEIGKVRDSSELSQMVENASMEYYQEIKKGDLVMLASWFRFPLYEVDFGWGRPSLVRALLGPGLHIWLMDYKDDAGGIEAWVKLKEHDMARFQQEPDILEYASTTQTSM